MRILLFFLFMLSLPAWSQAPHQFSFQGVTRDATGKVVANQSVKVRFTLHKTTANGPVFYQEEQVVTTGGSGVFVATVGTGTVLVGYLYSRKWTDGPYFLQVELDPAGGNAYVDVGTSQLLSVPFALHAWESASWKHDDPITQKGTLGQGETLFDNPNPGTRLIWYPRKGAFRAGGVDNDAWKELEIGNYSVAFGHNAKASRYGTAAIGDGAEALNDYAIALGRGTVIKDKYGVVLGSFNNTSGFVSNSIDGNDRLFQLGNGTAENDRHNAITVLRKGFVGIGENVMYPQYLFDVGSRMRIKHNPGKTAGLFLDGSQTDDNTIGPAAFVGMVNDDQVGFYIGNAWRFYVHANGSATLSGNLTQNSDLRLKKELAPLRESKSRLLGLTGYHYRWKDPGRSEAMQTGLVAQEVEKVFPELVETDAQGQKSVNYIGLIPHLIEAIKDLQKENEQMKARLDAGHGNGSE